MALDGIYLSLLKNELEPLTGGRVDKIHQPSKEEILISFRTRNGLKRLLINTGAGSARVHITNAEIENPKTPPMFCMFLRKHLSSAKLTAVRQDGFERILFFDFDATNEMGDGVKLTLSAEIMGSRSNLILIDENGKILDSIKRNTENTFRTILPGAEYVLPPKEERLMITRCEKEEFFEKLDSNGSQSVSKALMKTLEGISPVFARECEYNADSDETVQELDDKQREKLWKYICSVRRSVEDKNCTFTLLKTNEGAFKDFCFCDIFQYGELMEKKYFDSPSELLDFFYTQRDTLSRIKQKSGDLFRHLTSLTERTQRRVQNQKQELIECGEREKYKVMGDLITANMYSLKKGQKICRVQNFYDEKCPEVEIKLDERLTPSQNAQKYYKEYRKLDTAEKKLTELILKGEEEINYLESVLDLLTRAKTEGDIAGIREELAEQGYVKHQRVKGKPPRQLPPIKYISSDGYEIRVGRNNKQNDRLTCKESEKTDLWLHTKEVTGCHVIVSCDGKMPPDRTIEEAAIIAACNSKARNSSRVDVDYTFVKNVKKPNGAKPGMVIFTNNYTITVKPDEELVEKLRCK